jgi:hypothetical protein
VKKNIQQIVDLMLRTVVIFVTTLGERIEQKKKSSSELEDHEVWKKKVKKKANKSLVTVLVGIMLDGSLLH